jgi:hypothetical protein
MEKNKTKCSGFSKSKNAPCPYNGKYLHHDAKYYCKRHLPKEEKIYTVRLDGFPDFPPDLSSSSIKKLQTRIARGPTKSDEAGHIYIYYLPNDCYHYWKIGKTSQKLDARMDQWSKEHGVRILLKKSFKVKFAKYTERIIHLYLAHLRVYRYPVGKKFKTILAQSGLIVGDQHWKDLNQGEVDLTKYASSKKFVEWFMERDIDWIIGLIEKIIKAI